MNKPKVLVILGPTAVGKSDIAVWLAEKIGGEIISADSRQVYRGMDIGTGKITKEEMRGIPHHLLDVADPREIFTAGKFKKLADEKIGEILSRGKLPIICGGTGFYIDAIIKDIEYPPVPADMEFREMAKGMSAEELFAELLKLDPERAENIDGKNKVRLVRAIEIARVLGKVPKLNSLHSPALCSLHRAGLCREFRGKYEVLQIGIDLPDDILKDRIKKRLIKRIDGGMIEEVQKLVDSGISHERLFDLGLEYRFISEFLKGNLNKNFELLNSKDCHSRESGNPDVFTKTLDSRFRGNDRTESLVVKSKEDMLVKLYMAILHYAKRQRTWFKRDKTIKWFSPSDREEIEKEVRIFLK